MYSSHYLFSVFSVPVCVDVQLTLPLLSVQCTCVCRCTAHTTSSQCSVYLCVQMYSSHYLFPQVQDTPPEPHSDVKGKGKKLPTSHDVLSTQSTPSSLVTQGPPHHSMVCGVCLLVYGMVFDVVYMFNSTPWHHSSYHLMNLPIGLWGVIHLV